MFKDLLSAVFNIPYYRTLAQKSAGHTFGFLGLAWLIVAALLFAGAIFAVGPQLAQALKEIPPLRLENGVLTANGGRPFTLMLAGGVSAVYAPEAKFPPTAQELTKKNIFAYFTKDTVYMRSLSGGMQTRGYGDAKFEVGQNGIDWNSDPVYKNTFYISAFFGSLFAAPFLLFYGASGVFFAGALMFLFMRRQIMLSKIIKLSFYMAFPVSLLSLVLLALGAGAGVFQIAQFCFGGMFFQQILNGYKPLKFNKIDK